MSEERTPPPGGWPEKKRSKPRKKRLESVVRAVFPTATRLVLHTRLRHTRQGFRTMTELAAFDAQGHLLRPLREEGLADLQQQVVEAHAGGLVVLDLSA